MKNEISDCKDMDNWSSQCQLILSSNFGFDYNFFYKFLMFIIKKRLETLKNKEKFSVVGTWRFGENHIKFDLKKALTIFKMLENDVDFLDIIKFKGNMNHSLEFIDSLNSILK